jgi:hypothetical protein
MKLVQFFYVTFFVLFSSLLVAAEADGGDTVPEGDLQLVITPFEFKPFCPKKLPQLNISFEGESCPPLGSDLDPELVKQVQEIVKQFRSQIPKGPSRANLLAEQSLYSGRNLRPLVAYCGISSTLSFVLGVTTERKGLEETVVATILELGSPWGVKKRHLKTFKLEKIGPYYSQTVEDDSRGLRVVTTHKEFYDHERLGSPENNLCFYFLAEATEEQAEILMECAKKLRTPS